VYSANLSPPLSGAIAVTQKIDKAYIMTTRLLNGLGGPTPRLGGPTASVGQRLALAGACR
jgi:hypothetical protein